MKKYKVGKSEVHGRGLFATKRIRKGEVIGLIKAHVVDYYDHPHVLTMQGDLLLRVTCDLAYINHSDNPNVIYGSDGYVRATRNIQPGQEMLHYYGDEFNDGQ